MLFICVCVIIAAYHDQYKRLVDIEYWILLVGNYSLQWIMLASLPVYITIYILVIVLLILCISCIYLWNKIVINIESSSTLNKLNRMELN